jgi:hypothetical protein
MKKLLIILLAPLLLLRFSASALASELPLAKIEAAAPAKHSEMPVLISKRTKLTEAELAKYQQLAVQLDPRAKTLAAAAEGNDPVVIMLAVVGLLVLVAAALGAKAKNDAKTN